MTEKWHPTQAIDPDGKLADVRNVLNGLKCGCICFECEQRVIAKQGQKVRWYFAHYAASNCRPTPESELHFFAKELLAQRLCLWIPASELNAAGKSVILSKRKEFAFAKVVVEQQDGNVRPDLILISKDGRPCHVEIFVRHKVDSIKLDKLKTRNISSFEIDLSKLCWDDRSGWKNAILETAPRRWLHNAKAEEAATKLVKQAKADAKQKADSVQKEVSRISAILSKDDEVSGALGESGERERLLACRRGFHSMIDRGVKGEKCFAVPRSHWQSSLVNRLLWDNATGSKAIFETKDALAHVSHLIRTGLNYISPEASTELAKFCPDFASPWHAVNDYLRWLKDRHSMFDKHLTGKQWLMSGSAAYHRRMVENEWREERERKSYLSEWLDTILSRLPEAENRAFDRPSWVDWFSSSYDDDGSGWKLRQIWEMVMEDGGPAEDLLGLPLEGEYERQARSEAERRAEQQRRWAADQREAQRNSRIRTIYADAHQKLINADGWLESSNSELDGAMPSEFAAHSDEALATVTSLLAKLVQARREQSARNEEHARRQSLLKKNRMELDAEALKRTSDPNRAKLWLNSHHPKLGGVKPLDYCVDSRAQSYCLSIMPKQI